MAAGPSTQRRPEAGECPSLWTACRVIRGHRRVVSPSEDVVTDAAFTSGRRDISRARPELRLWPAIQGRLRCMPLNAAACGADGNYAADYLLRPGLSFAETDRSGSLRAGN